MTKYAQGSDGHRANHLSNGVVQNVVSGVASAESAVFGASTTIVRLTNLADCRYVVGTSPQTALATGTLLLAGVIEHIGVEPGQVIATIQDTVAGVLNVTECG